MTSWRKIFGSNETNSRRRDNELILRLFSLSKVSGVPYASNMKHFLNDCMEKHRSGQTDGWIEFASSFDKWCKTILSEFREEKPFHIDRGLKISVLDAVFCNFIDEGGSFPENFKQKFKALIEDPRFNDLTTKSTTSQKTISERFRMVRDLWS